MFLLKWLRNFGRVVRGGHTPLQLTLGATLGFMFGMVPGINATGMILLVLLLVLNANLVTGVAAILVGKALMILLAPLSFQVGWILIHGSGLEGAIAASAEIPVVALMDLHYYCLTGGLALGLGFGLVFGVLFARAVLLLRAALTAAAGRRTAAAIAQFPPVRLLLRLIFGKRREAQKRRLFRSAGVIIAAAAVLLVCGVVWFAQDVLFAEAATRGLSLAAGAEVNIRRAELRAFSGRLELGGVQITDRAHPERNLVEWDAAAGDVSIRGLLTRRYVIDELRISGFRTGTKRPKPGEVYDRLPEPAPPTEGTLNDILAKGEKLLEYLRRLREWMEKHPVPERKEPSKEEMERIARAKGYFALNARHLLAEHPTLVIRKVTVEGVEIGGLGGTYALAALNLSDKPELYPEPMRLAVADTSPDEPLELGAMEFRFYEPGGRHFVSLATPPLPLDGVNLGESMPLALNEGAAQVAIVGGEFTNTRFVRLPFVLGVTGLRTAPRGEGTFLGLDPQVSRTALRHLRRVQLKGVLSGEVDQPTVTIDRKALLDNIRRALIAAGKAEAARRVNQRLGQVTDRLKDKLGPESSRALDILSGRMGEEGARPATAPAGRLLDGLLNPKKDKDGETGKEEEESNPLEDLFR